jgi:hypothetical protein
VPEPPPPPTDIISAFGFLPPGPSIGGFFTQLCAIRRMQAIQDALGMGTQLLAEQIPNVPCTLQPMSTADTMLYKAESAASMFVLLLPLRLEGSSVELPSVVGTEFVIDGIKYRVAGEGLRQGQSGVQKLPVEKVNR